MFRLKQRQKILMFSILDYVKQPRTAKLSQKRTVLQMVKAGSEMLALKIASDLQELVAWVLISMQLIAAYNIEFGLL